MLASFLYLCRKVAQDVSMTTQAISNRELGSERWIESDPVEFRKKFNERSFEARHHLSNHSLFQIDELMNLAKRTRNNNPTSLYYDGGNLRVDQEWASISNVEFSIEDAMGRIADCGAWIGIKHAQEDPAYRIL